MAQVPVVAAAGDGRKASAQAEDAMRPMTMRVRRMSAFLGTSGSPRPAPIGRTLETSALGGVRASEQVSGWERDHAEHTVIENRAGAEARPRRAGVPRYEEAAVGAARPVVDQTQVQRAVSVFGKRLHEAGRGQLQETKGRPAVL